MLVAAPKRCGLSNGSRFIEPLANVSANESNDVIGGLFACSSGLMNDVNIHLRLSIVDDSTLILFDESDESELEPSDSLSLELSLFGDVPLFDKQYDDVINVS